MAHKSSIGMMNSKQRRLTMNANSEKIDLHRRHLVGGAAMTAAVVQLGI